MAKMRVSRVSRTGKPYARNEFVKQVNLVLDPRVKAMLAEMSLEQGRTYSDLMKQALLDLHHKYQMRKEELRAAQYRTQIAMEKAGGKHLDQAV